MDLIIASLSEKIRKAQVEERLVELETRVAFQDDLLRKLDDIVSRQSIELDSLILQVRRLQEQLEGMEPPHLKSQAEETPPPHY